MSGIVGQTTLDTGNLGSVFGYTYLVNLNEVGADAGATANGTCKTVDIQCSGAGTVKIKFFRISGGTVLYLGGTGNLTVATGLNEFTISPVALQIGDYISVYFASNVARGSSHAPGPPPIIIRKAGDITSDTNLADWENNGIYQIAAKGFIDNLRPFPTFYQT